MFEVVLSGGAAAAVGVGAWAMRQRRMRELSRDRLAEPFVQIKAEREVGPPVLRGARMWIPPAVALVVWVVLGPIVGVALPFALSLSCVVGILLWIYEDQRAQKESLDLEAQLAEGIDFIVGSLGAGGGTLDSIDNASKEVRQPLGGLFEDIVGRLRYGDTPRAVLEDLAERVPLESFRLFSFTVLVHEETGGSLAPILSSVGRTMRDRIDLARRVRSESRQSMASVVGILFITYAIAVVTWQVDPERMEAFLSDETGAQIAAGAVFLQAVGLLIMSKLSRIRY
jgi:tight adherence protein B